MADLPSVCLPAISSHSLGRAYAGHTLRHKLERAAAVGFKGIELFWEDVEDFAKTVWKAEMPPPKRLVLAASSIRAICERLRLTIVCLQPFTNYEGSVFPHVHEQQIQRMKQWIQVARELGTDLIAIPSTYQPADATSADLDRIASDLRQVADMGLAGDGGASRQIRFTYEALSFGTHVDTWERSWEVVKRVDRPNFGLCLDTFNIAARAWADPAHYTGERADAWASLRSSLGQLSRMGAVDRVFQLQVVDGALLNAALDQHHPMHVRGQSPRMTWSRNCRLFYGERDLGAYLPVDRICGVIFNELGWRGWVSMELFNSSMDDADDQVPTQHAERGFRSWQKLVADFPTTVVRRPTDEETAQARRTREKKEIDEFAAVRAKVAAAALKATQESPKEENFGANGRNGGGAH